MKTQPSFQTFRPASLAGMLVLLAALSLPAQQGATAAQENAPTVFKTTVRRVIVDVVVTDKNGKTVPDLTREDFSIFEDNQPQQVLSFDALGFSKSMDYAPPKLPPEPPNTFVNLPTAPEKGPLYVLLYDLVNMQSYEEQALARKELIKFIDSKPEGTRFAIFMFSDGLHMVQGFTSDKNLLFTAIDPNHSRAHVPKIFLMGRNFGQNDAPTAVWILRTIANYLDGLPGRKNVIWLSGGFPLALFPSDKDNLQYYEEVKQTLDLLARDQIAIYPVDTRGVSVDNPHDPPGSAGGDAGITTDSREGTPSKSATPSPGSAGMGGTGISQLSSSYMAEDEIARTTGGRAFYSRNDIGVALEQATEEGASYYSLSYAPTDRDYDDKLHNIRVELAKVELAKKGYTLAYRRSYYAVDPHAPLAGAVASHTPPAQTQTPGRPVGDTLSANMEHGAPIAHALLFGAHVQPVGSPALGTPAQMAALADEPAFFKTRRKNSQPKPLAPIKLQKYAIDYTVMKHQLQISGATAPNLEIAAAAYDSDGTLLNAAVNLATTADNPQAGTRPAYQIVQELLVPLHAASLRLAVRDANTDRIGAMEITLPLQPETDTQQHTAAK